MFQKNEKFLHILIPVFILIGSYLIYKNIYPNPRNWYDHYLYLSKSIMQGRIDLPDLPSFYHDKIEFKGKNFIPFPPGASFLLLPFLMVSKTITQQQVSIIIGSFSVVLMYLLLQKFTNKLNAILLTLFFGFGTSFFWSAVVGTTWFFAHVSAVFFLLLSLLLHFSKKDFLSGIFFALSALTRLPLLVAGLFYLFQLFKEQKRFIYFLIGSFVFIPIMLSYNFLRFGNFFEMGYKIVYNQYNNSGVKVSISDNFGYFSYKNIPLHIYSFFAMPPNIEIADGIVKSIKPSPFGMGIIFTSPLLLLIFWPNFKKGIELNAAVTALFCALPSFFHYAQGWVQFGYRFILDFIVFLMIILSIRFKASILNIFLISISVIINFWGVLWAIELGW